MSYIVFRPLEAWTDQTTHEPRSHPFDSGWEPTVDLLRTEVDRVSLRHADTEIVLQVMASERDVRRDGMLRADARVRGDGVVISFDSMHGPLRYACDTFTGRSWRNRLAGWQANVRAIALALEALRKVDRYGVGGRGEQYTGWSQIGTGRPMPAAPMTMVDALRFMREHGDLSTSTDVRPGDLDAAYRQAAKRLHPDVGGDAEMFKLLQQAYKILT